MVDSRRRFAPATNRGTTREDERTTKLLEAINHTSNTFEAIEEWVSPIGIVGAYRMHDTLFSDGSIQIYLYVDGAVFVTGMGRGADEAALHVVRTIARFGNAMRVTAPTTAADDGEAVAE